MKKKPRQNNKLGKNVKGEKHREGPDRLGFVDCSTCEYNHDVTAMFLF